MLTSSFKGKTLHNYIILITLQSGFNLEYFLEENQAKAKNWLTKLLKAGSFWGQA